MLQLADVLQAARTQVKAARIAPEDLPPTAAAAYAVARQQAPQPAAWKIGGANPWSRQVFENAEVFFGPLAASEVAIETETLSLAGLHAPLAEPEIMLELGGDPAADMPFSQMGLGFEIPASVLPEALKGKLAGQMADRAGAGALWISAVRPFEAEKFQAQFAASFRRNNEPAGEGGSANIIGGPLGAAQEFLQLARSYGMPLKEGQWVATGGLCPAIPAVAGDRLECSAMGMRVTLHLA
ncbi:hypothetical protein [Leisingera sp. ANG-M7]|uniref:hypothetical protein n=1 Tax=Leisingera sp. ANG-M7 TaxID=1577902 RepID=UPI00057E2D61|nr:hypothetical protein [Leisingera sp. ANG-M7]KIC36435.1 hypothetical protein RA26_13110 [Leisingera sp. ANG-M7]